MLKVFIGYDHRQPLAFNVAAHSVVRTASQPVAITALRAPALPIARFGLTEFTFSRFLVPHLCDYVGDAIFMDSDVVVRSDIVELFELCRAQPLIDVAVNKNQPRFEWPSVMYFRCDSHGCSRLTPEYIADVENNPLDLSWAAQIGDISAQWNHCVNYADDDDGDVAKLLHFTEGIPCWAETMNNRLDDSWRAARNAMQHTVDWTSLMAKSVHARQTLTRFLRNRGVNV